MSLSRAGSGGEWWRKWEEGDGPATPQPDELEGDSVEPEDAPTLGTFFVLLSCDLAMLTMIDQVANILYSTVDIWDNS
jgi:hypothetical protein